MLWFFWGAVAAAELAGGASLPSALYADCEKERSSFSASALGLGLRSRLLLSALASALGFRPRLWLSLSAFSFRSRLWPPPSAFSFRSQLSPPLSAFALSLRVPVDLDREFRTEWTVDSGLSGPRIPELAIQTQQRQPHDAPDGLRQAPCKTPTTVAERGLQANRERRQRAAVDWTL